MNAAENEMAIEIEKGRLNIFNAGGMLLGVIVTTFGWGVTYSQMTTANEQLKQQTMTLSQRLADVEKKMPQFEVIALQVQRVTEIAAANTKSIEATNDRLSRIVENQSAKLDNISNKIGDLTTEIRVVQSQLKVQSNGGTSRTRYPIVEVPETRIR